MNLLYAFNNAIVTSDLSTALSYMTPSQADAEKGVRSAYGLVGLDSVPKSYHFSISAQSKNSSVVDMVYTTDKGDVKVPITLERVKRVWMVAVIQSAS